MDGVSGPGGRVGPLAKYLLEDVLGVDLEVGDGLQLAVLVHLEVVHREIRDRLSRLVGHADDQVHHGQLDLVPEGEAPDRLQLILRIVGYRRLAHRHGAQKDRTDGHPASPSRHRHLRP